MKKINLAFSLLITFFVLIGCSSEADNSAKIQINPPTWIRGTWLLDGTLFSGWRFTSNDFITIQASSEISQRGQLESLLEFGQDVSANDESTDNTYTVTANYSKGQTTVYSFTKVSDTEISWSAVSNSIYTKQ